MTDNHPAVPDLTDFDGCGRACRPRNKPWSHTHVWGECEWAKDPGPFPPTFGRWVTHRDGDGELSIGWETIPSETRSEWGVKAKDRPNAGFANSHPLLSAERAESFRAECAERHPDIEWLVLSRTVTATPWQETQ